MNTQWSIRMFWLWPTVMTTGLAVLALVPGGLAETSRVLLHGLCAQTPDHTFTIGGQPLPFDARMTGIYSGALSAGVVLAVKGRWLRSRLPSISILLMLGVFVAAMATDGLNSLLTDIRYWHPWQTTNQTRMVTGYLAGVALAVALIWLFSGTAFRIAYRRPILESWLDLALCVAPLALWSLALWTAPAWLYLPVALFLVASAWSVLATLALVTVLLATKADERVFRVDQLHLPGVVGLVVGLIVMLLLSAGRQWLEQTLGIPSTL